MRILTSLYVILLICFYSTNTFSNNFVRLDSVNLAKSKIKILNGTASEGTMAAYKKLIRTADKLLKKKNATVMDKVLFPPTGNKHDYLSISRYWWPNPETTSGFPYIRKDGKTNPESQNDDVDRQRFAFMGKSVWWLSLAYYFTEDEKYAEKGVSMIVTWFLDPETRMNPNLEHAQSVPGRVNVKRPYGILDARSLVRFIPDALKLVSNSKHWTNENENKMNSWLSTYLRWLTKSEIGIKASKLKNNHVSWYRFQVASIAYYIGDESLARQTVKLAEKSLNKMLNKQGGQILELERSRSFFYSCFNLQALIHIANIGDKLGMDMWKQDKKSLMTAIDYLTPAVYAQKWKRKKLKAKDLAFLAPILSEAADKYDSVDYRFNLKTVLNIVKGNKLSTEMQEFWLFNTDN